VGKVPSDYLQYNSDAEYVKKVKRYLSGKKFHKTATRLKNIAKLNTTVSKDYYSQMFMGIRDS